jgi:hypothetical protein
LEFLLLQIIRELSQPIILLSLVAAVDLVLVRLLVLVVVLVDSKHLQRTHCQIPLR